MDDWRSELEVEQSQSRYMGNKAYWVYGELHNRLYIMGPYSSEDAADREACNRFSESHEIIGLMTQTGRPLTNRDTATSIIKKRRMDEQNLALDEATRNARHYSKE